MADTEPFFLRRNNRANTFQSDPAVHNRNEDYSFGNEGYTHDSLYSKRKKTKILHSTNSDNRRYSKPIRKLYWITVLTTGLAISIYNVYNFWSLYFRYPIVLNIAVDENYTFIDPSVTVCNLNRYRASAQGKSYNNTYFEDGKRGTALVLSERKELASCPSMQSLKNESLSKLIFLVMYSSSTKKERFRDGHQPSTFIKECVFNDVTCSSKNFTLFQSLRYGNCFTFKGLYNDIGSSSPGLHLTLNLERMYYREDAATVGARVVVHSSRETPDLERNGFNVLPGFETFLSVRPRVTRRLPFPYRDTCRDYPDSAADNQDQCVRKCIQDVNFSSCDCVDPSLIDDPRKHCNLTDASDICCLDDVDLRMSSDGPPCDCPLPCTSIEFKVQKSLAIWPSFSYVFLSTLKQATDYWKTDMNEEEFAILMEQVLAVWKDLAYDQRKDRLQSHAKLRISLPAIEYQIYEQLARFEEAQLFSVAGGELGIWLGLSISSFFGIAEMGCSWLWKRYKAW